MGFRVLGLQEFRCLGLLGFGGTPKSKASALDGGPSQRSSSRTFRKGFIRLVEGTYRAFKGYFWGRGKRCALRSILGLLAA